MKRDTSVRMSNVYIFMVTNDSTCTTIEWCRSEIDKNARTQNTVMSQALEPSNSTQIKMKTFKCLLISMCFGNVWPLNVAVCVGNKCELGDTQQLSSEINKIWFGDHFRFGVIINFDSHQHHSWSLMNAPWIYYVLGRQMFTIRFDRFAWLHYTMYALSKRSGQQNTSKKLHSIHATRRRTQRTNNWKMNLTVAIDNLGFSRTTTIFFCFASSTSFGYPLSIICMPMGN